MDAFEIMVPCIGFVAFFFLIFGTVAVLRWFRHKELLAMIQQGGMPEQYANMPRVQNEHATRNWGVALTALGLALVVGLWPLDFVGGPTYVLGLGPWMLAGFIPMFLGLALLIIYYLTRKEQGARGPQAEEESDAV